MSATQTIYVYSHLVCSRLALATFAAGTPRRVLGSTRLTGGPNVSRRSRTLRRIDIQHIFRSRAPSLTTLFGVCPERGRFLPTALMRSSLWHSCRNLLWFILRLTHLRECCVFAVRPFRPFFGSELDTYGSEDAEITKTTVDTASWKPIPRDDPECLLSIGTLRRIRWSLQPRSHDHRTAFGDVMTAEWWSLITLGLPPILAIFSGQVRLATSFRSTRLPMVSPTNLRSELGPRSLDPATLFGVRLPSLFETSCRLTTSATNVSTCEQPNQVRLWILAGTETSISFLFFNTSRPPPCDVGEMRRAALHPSNQPQCWFLSVARVCPTVMPACPPHHHRLSPVMHSEDWCARVEGPSEGRVL